MATLISRLRGTTAILNSTIGPEGLIAVDINRQTLRLFDGVTLGGKEIVTKDRTSESLTGVPAVLRDWNKAGLLYHSGPTGEFRPVILESGGGIELVEVTISGQPVLVLRADSTVPDTSTQMIAGDGLTGGGSLAANRTFSVDSTVVRITRAIVAGDGLTGGGTLDTNRSLAVDSTVVRTPATVVRTTRSVTGGSGLTGGGTLDSDRVITPDFLTAEVSAIPAVDSKVIGDKSLFTTLSPHMWKENQLVDINDAPVASLTNKRFVYLSKMQRDLVGLSTGRQAVGTRGIKLVFNDVSLSGTAACGIFLMDTKSDTIPPAVPNGVTYSSRAVVFTNAASPAVVSYTDRIGIPTSVAAETFSGVIDLIPSTNPNSPSAVNGWTATGTLYIGAKVATIVGRIMSIDGYSRTFLFAIGNTVAGNTFDSGSIQAYHN